MHAVAGDRRQRARRLCLHLGQRPRGGRSPRGLEVLGCGFPEDEAGITVDDNQGALGELEQRLARTHHHRDPERPGDDGSVPGGAPGSEGDGGDGGAQLRNVSRSQVMREYHGAGRVGDAGDGVPGCDPRRATAQAAHVGGARGQGGLIERVEQSRLRVRGLK